MSFFRRKTESKFRSTDVLGTNKPTASSPAPALPPISPPMSPPQTPVPSHPGIPTVSELMTLARTSILQNPDSPYWWSQNGRRICESWLAWWITTYPDSTTTGNISPTGGEGKVWEEVFRKDMEHKELKSASAIGFLSALKKRLDEDVKKRGKKKRRVGEMVVRGPRRE